MARKFNWRNVGGGLVNAALPGSPYNRFTGQFNPAATRASLITAGANQIAGPLAGGIAGLVLNRNPQVQAHYAGLRGYGAIEKQLSQRPDANQLGLDVPDVGMAGYERGYALNPAEQQIPTMPTVTAQADGWSGGLGTSNAFNGGLGNWINAQPQGRSYGQAGGSFTPWGAGVVQVAGQGWGGSDAAAGFGLGAQGSGGGSAGSIAVADAQRANRKNRV